MTPEEIKSFCAQNGIRFVDMPWILQSDHPAVMIYARGESIAPGSDYDLEKLQDAQRRIAESGYYDSVFVYAETSTDGQTLPVMVACKSV